MLGIVVLGVTFWVALCVQLELHERRKRHLSSRGFCLCARCGRELMAEDAAVISGQFVCKCGCKTDPWVRRWLRIGV